MTCTHINATKEHGAWTCPCGYWWKDGDTPRPNPTPDHAIKWEVMTPEEAQIFIGPPCPDQCPEGAESHTWIFEWSAFDGPGISTSECFICNRGAQESDWPREYLTIELKVRLEGVTELCGGYYDPEYDHFVYMTPVEQKEETE